MAFTCMMATPVGSLFNGDVWQVTIPGSNGLFSIRTGHMPVIATMTNGIVEIAESESNRTRYRIQTGIVEFKENMCRILVEKSEPVE